MNEVTQLLDAVNRCEAAAGEQLLPLIYDELRKLAAAQMAREKPGQTLDATALVHEAWLRLFGAEGNARFEHRRHFFAAAAQAMRRILIDRARRKRRQRHGGLLKRVDARDIQAVQAVNLSDILDLDEALTEFEAQHPPMAELVTSCGTLVSSCWSASCCFSASNSFPCAMLNRLSTSVR